MATNTGIEVTFFPKNQAVTKTDDSQYVFEQEEEFLSDDPVIHYDHAELTQIGNPAALSRPQSVLLSALHLVSGT